MKRTTLAVVLVSAWAAAVPLASAPAWAQDEPEDDPVQRELEIFEQPETAIPPPPRPETWLTREHATGDWGGLRTELEEAGVTFELGYFTDLLALVHGGAAGGGNWDYAGLMLGAIRFDLEKLLGLRGTKVVIGGSWSSGNDLSRKVGNAFTVAETFTGRSVRLVQLYVEQSLLDDALRVKGGRLVTNDDFLSSPLYLNYVSGGINSAPLSLPGSTAGFTTPPFAQWGAAAIYTPSKQWRVGVGVYQSDDNVIKDKHNGVDFTIDPGKGVMTIGEIGYLLNQEEGASGLPGNYKLGAFHDSGRFARQDGNGTSRDNYGFYVAIDQMVYREGDEGEQGLTPWAVVTYAPRSSINELPVFVGAGLVYQGLLPGRDDDRTSLGFFYGSFSRDIDDTSGEKVVEVNHSFFLTPWFYVMPSAQFVFRPSGRSAIDNAIVIGGEIGITF